ncbi:hypothetical protein C8Q78DRAFT_1038833 [Trametes maxima]|nr:hypothetical protein C8Q78DRAFT_1038833 [Trametes maxima]
MADSSDTESETSLCTSGWDAADFMQMSVELGRVDTTAAGPFDLCATFDTLRNVDICAIEHDERLLEIIQLAANTLLGFLTRVIDTGKEELLHKDFVEKIPVFLNEESLSLLLRYRVLFRDIASRNLGEASSAIAVCWVDVVLAKLGQAIAHTAGMLYGISSSEHDLPIALRAQKEDDLLRAAVQLPESWPSIIQLLCCEYASPAAIRLACSLVWGATVMIRQLSTEISTSSMLYGDLLRVLQQRIKQTSKEVIHARTYGDDASEQERMTNAMLVTMYAAADSLTIDNVNSPLPSSGVHPVTRLDLPSTILIKWGTASPWSWGIWEDARLHNSEVVESLSATWLYHLDTSAASVHSAHSVEWWDTDLVEALESMAVAALSMMSRLLLCSVLFMKESDSQPLESPALDVVLKACWAIKHLLQILGADVDDTTSSVLFTIMHKLFLLLGDGGLEPDVKDLIIEGLSYSNTGLRLSLEGIVTDPRSECVLGWEHKLGRVIKLLKTVRSSAGVLSALELRNVRQMLQFLTLAGKTGLIPCSVPGQARQFLSAVLGWLDVEELHSPVWSMLGDTAIGALAVWRQHVNERAHSIPKTLWRDLVWSIFEEADPLDLPLAASLAAYVSATARDRVCDALSCGEAWNYFRDVILLVLNREYGGAEEPLSLLIAPAVSRALEELAQHAPSNAKRCCMSSPWTLSMLTQLKRLGGKQDHADEYDKVLWKLLSSVLGSLHSQAEKSGVENATAGKDQKDASESIFCWSNERACVIQT